MNIIQKQFNKELPLPGKTGLDWYLFCYFANKFKDSKLLEIGVGDGGSLFSLLAYSNDVTVIDSWAQGWAKEPIITHANTLNKSIKFIDEDSCNINADDLEIYNFIHLDANKQYDKVIQDLKLCDKISNGIVCVDDYMNSMWPEVTWAVDDFIRDDTTWRIILIGNHQIFIAKQDIQIKEIIMNCPIVYRNNIVYLTYGELPPDADDFIKNGAMTYSWHNIAWPPNTTK